MNGPVPKSTVAAAAGSIKIQEVICPHCQASQMEPLGVISTNCKKCGNYFRLAESRTARSVRPPRATPQGLVRTVICAQCQTSNRVSDTAMSTQCVRCSNYLDLRDVVIRGSSSERIHTYGELSFANGCAYRGFAAQASRIEVFGKVFSKLESTSDILIGEGGQVSGEIRAQRVEIQRGATAHVQSIFCKTLFIDGQVEVIGTTEALELTVRNGGSIKSARLRAYQINVEEGCRLEANFETLPAPPPAEISEETAPAEL